MPPCYPTLQSAGMPGDGPIAAAIRDRAPWFHNLHLDDGSQTAPDHPLGDFPSYKWRCIADLLPDCLDGWRVLDIGCNAGYYSFALAGRGAAVLGVEHDPHYLEQARWAAGQIAVAGSVSFEQRDVYDLAQMSETFDLVLFMGVFYHLRYPLLGLDIVSRLSRRWLLFQSLTSSRVEALTGLGNLGLHDREAMTDPGWPSMAFIEHEFVGDPSNWWIPNRAGCEAMLRSVGYRIDTVLPQEEVFFCHRQHASTAADGQLQAQAATARRFTTDRA
jgi:tRNA (mo5U34)-methyltransferase